MRAFEVPGSSASRAPEVLAFFSGRIANPTTCIGQKGKPGLKQNSTCAPSQKGNILGTNLFFLRVARAGWLACQWM